MPPRVHIILLNWNGWRDSLACLESLHALTYPNWTVTVVDNASTDDSVAYIRSRFPEMDLLESNRNLGFAEGNNLGIRRALASGADYVWLLNNDTIVAPACLEPLIEAAEQQPAVGVVVPKIYYADPPRLIWYAGATYRPYFGQSIMSGFRELDDGTRYEAITEVPFVTGCALLAKRRVWEQVGLLDPDYFFGVEDLDFSLRAREAGWKCLLAPRSHIWHKVSASSGGSQSPLNAYFYARNRLLLMRRHGRWWHWPTFLAQFAASQLWHLGRAVWRRKSLKPAEAVWLAVSDFARGRFGLASGEKLLPARRAA